MRFLKTYAVSLILCVIFFYCGGWMLFDLSRHFFATIAACALLLAVLASVFWAQSEKLEQLEARVQALEKALSSRSADE